MIKILKTIHIGINIGGAKSYVCPPNIFIGGAAAPPAPPLLTPLCSEEVGDFIVSKADERSKTANRTTRFSDIPYCPR